MRLSEIKGVDAIDVLADIIDPVAEILADEEIKKVIAENKPKIIIAKTILKQKNKEILEILAVLNGEDPKTYKPSLIQLPIMLLGLISDVMENKELTDLFQLQEQMRAGVSSIPATVTTEETEKM